MDKKYVIDGREYAFYELSNEQLVQLLYDDTLMGSDKEIIKDRIIECFILYFCKKDGESNDELFARQFSSFVNGKMGSPRKVAEKMASKHRYLQQEMFKVCFEYIKVLANNGEKGCFDARNQYAVNTSRKIIKLLDASEVIY
jgi:hypothetical protein